MPLGAETERVSLADLARHAERLRDRGFTVVPEPVIDGTLIESARALSKERLAKLLDDVRAAGCDPVEQQYRFREIATRQRNRWDLQLQDPAQGLDDSAWSQLCRAAVAAATPIIREAQGDDYSGVEPVMVGAVISRPGARVQRFHCDATHEHFAAAKANASHRLYNIFVPLVDVRENSDGTQFWAAPELEASTCALGERDAGEEVTVAKQDGLGNQQFDSAGRRISQRNCVCARVRVRARLRELSDCSSALHLSSRSLPLAARRQATAPCHR